jgi:hypothetical protein
MAGQGGGGGGMQMSLANLGEQMDGNCPVFPRLLTGTGDEGAPCKTARDCAPVCCVCGGNGTHGWLAASCTPDGVCAELDGVCNLTMMPSYCPR